MNLRLKLTIAAALDKLGLLTAFRKMQSSKYGIVLTFHRVLLDTEIADCYNPHVGISQSVFEQLLLLLRREFHIVSLSELVEQAETLDGRQRVALTFDDGWEDTHSVAYPLLLRYRLPATVFLCTGLVDRMEQLPEERFAFIWQHCEKRGRLRALTIDLKKWGGPTVLSFEQSKWSQHLKSIPMQTKLLLMEHLEDAYGVPKNATRRLMTWEEAQQMSRNNIGFGSHTASHCTLNSEPDSTIVDELVMSREAIRRNIGVEAAHLAYPNGSYSKRVMQLAEDAGFTHAFTTETGLLSTRTNRYKIPRISIDNLAVTDESSVLHPARVRFHMLHAVPR
jgi:peptidoglycan/xylan/chitin deacetylase (PgdA/CDA1 family)